MTTQGFTPRETVSELDRYIVGQNEAKKAVAIALRNRWRRRQLDVDLQSDVSPKNIIMIGPTGVGKTEIARRLARLSGAPFVKVEASKFTEVGYVGRDVESMIRDLVDASIKLVKEEETARIEAQARRKAEAKLVQLVIDQYGPSQSNSNVFAVDPDGSAAQKATHVSSEVDEVLSALRRGTLDHLEVTVEHQQTATPAFEIVGAAGMEEMMSGFKDALSQLQSNFGGGQRSKSRKMALQEALKVLTDQESDELIDNDHVLSLALERAQQEGIIFLDEIDKIALAGTRGGSGQGPDVSRGGVQRDLLPIVEGTTVNTKHGVIRTDHILFIAAGAFHESKVSDLVPELQGRFPIRVELSALGEEEFFRILTEPKNSLVKQYQALLGTERVDVSFSESGLRTLAKRAYEANTKLENIGARRLHTILEKVLEDISFNAPEMKGTAVELNAQTVGEILDPVLADEDLSRYIL